MTETRQYSVQVSDDGTRCDIEFPHFPYSGYSGTGLPNPWALTRCLESGRFIAYRGNFCSGQDMIMEGGMLVIVQADYKFNWSLLSGSRRTEFFPFKIAVRLVRVGRTSVVWHHDMINLLDNNVLVTLEAKMVLVDRKTRRAKAFSPWFLQKYGHLQDLESPYPRAAVEEMPTSRASFSLPVTVMPSNVDSNEHLNNSEAIKLCLDCVAFASLKDMYKYVQEDVRKLWLLELSVYYRKEGYISDDLVVTTWEGSDPGAVMAKISRSEDVVSFYRMRFSPPTASL